jgi:uncharacterized phage protein gp47/JayE
VTLDELAQPLTAAEFEEALYSAIAAQGISTTTWKEGAVTRVIVSALAIALAALSVLLAFFARSGFLELATGDWLDLVAEHVYGTPRIGETFATGVVTLTNDTGVGSFVDVQPGDLIVRNAAGKTYRNTEVFTLGATPAATVDVDVQAEEAGSASSTDAGTITAFVTAFSGCSVENAVGLIGNDRETDVALRARARAKTGALSPNGPKDAYYYVATSAKRADGTPIGVTRVRSIPDGVGGIDVYVADEDATVTGTVGDLDTDLGRIDDDIQKKSAPLGIAARLHTATPQDIAVTYEAWVESSVGYSEPALEAAITDALRSYLATAPIGGERLPLISGGWIYVSGLAACIADFVGQQHLVRLTITTPAADVSIGDTSAPRLGTVTATLHLVPSTEGV